MSLPRPGQVPVIEVSQSTFTNFTIIQGQQFEVNWTITGGFGKSYLVTQIGEQASDLINFGYINADPFYVYGLLNSSQLGTFAVRLEVFNLTYSITQGFTLFVKPNLDFIIPQVFLIVTGSVAVTVVCTVMIQRIRNKQQYRTKRVLDEKILKVGTSSSNPSSPGDETFIATTVINCVAVAATSPIERWTCKKFQDLIPEEAWKEAILKNVMNTPSQILSCKNICLKINDNVRYLTCYKHPGQDLAIIVISMEMLNEKFLSLLFNSIKILARRDPDLIQDPAEYIEELTRILCLNRSYDYQIPGTVNKERLEQSKFWTSRGALADEIKPQEMQDIEEDLKGMTKASVDAMVSFLDRIEKEFESKVEKEN